MDAVAFPTSKFQAFPELGSAAFARIGYFGEPNTVETQLPVVAALLTDVGFALDSVGSVLSALVVDPATLAASKKGERSRPVADGAGTGVVLGSAFGASPLSGSPAVDSSDLAAEELGERIAHSDGGLVAAADVLVRLVALFDDGTDSVAHEFVEHPLSASGHASPLDSLQ